MLRYYPRRRTPRLQVLFALVLGAAALHAQNIDPATPNGAAPYVTDGSLPSGWTLTFSDEFNGGQGSAINPRWNTHILIDRGVSANGGATPYHWYHSSSYVSVDGSGHADLQVVDSGTKDSGGREIFYAGRLDTTKTGWTGAAPNNVAAFAQTYGYFEARIQIQSATETGHQAAWWVYPPAGTNPGNVTDGSGDDGAEYDILESNQQLNGYSTDVHFDGYASAEQSTQEYEGNSDVASGDGLGIDKHPFPQGNDVHTGFHTFGLYWSATKVCFYYDGVLYRTLTDPIWISKVAEFPILSGGIQSNGWNRGDIFNAVLPDHILVDYVRIWSATTPPGSAPKITANPTSQSVATGSTVTLNVTATGATSYQWYWNGAPIGGATNASLVISNIGTYQRGSYTVDAINASGTTTSSAATVSVTSSARLMDISTRALVSDAQPLIAGFVIQGSGNKLTLLRGIGPTLSVLNVPGVLPQPQMTLYDNASKPIVTQGPWGGNATVAATAVQVGAFSLPANSADVAFLRSVASAPYTAVVSPRNGVSGIGLVEVYDADAGGSSTRLVNISARAFAGTGVNVLDAGFVVAGSTSESVLVRGIGPTLSELGVPNPISATTLTVYDSNSQPIATNTGWGGDPSLAAIFNQVGAFSLPTDSTDSAMLLTIPPGVHSVIVTGPNGLTGNALVEVYELP